MKYSYDYDRFGNRWAQSVVAGACTVPTEFRFAGMQQDSEITAAAVYATWFRQYDTSEGRWLGVDPIPGSADNAQSLDRYVYVFNDPANLVDPFGLWPDEPQDPGFRIRVDVFALAGGGESGTITPVPGQCVNVYQDGILVGKICNGRSGQSGGGPGGGGTFWERAVPRPPAPKPWECSGTARILNSIDVIPKMGLEIKLLKYFNAGVTIFKNLSTDETGTEAELSKWFIGGNLKRTLNPGRSSSSAARPEGNLFVGPFNYNVTTGEKSVDPNASLGLTLGIGAEFKFNVERFQELTRKCGNPD